MLSVSKISEPFGRLTWVVERHHHVFGGGQTGFPVQVYDADRLFFDSIDVVRHAPGRVDHKGQGRPNVQVQKIPEFLLANQLIETGDWGKQQTKLKKKTNNCAKCLPTFILPV